MQLDYTVATGKDFDQAVEAVVSATADAGFRVLFVHDVAATLAEKGFERERVSIVEMCNAKYASQVLAADVKIGLCSPAPSWSTPSREASISPPCAPPTSGRSSRKPTSRAWPLRWRRC